MDIYYALAEPKRRSILEMLANSGELSATAIAKRFRITTAAVSQHLKVLREAKLVIVEKRAQQRIYSIDVDGLKELEKWAQRMSDSYDALDVLLKNKA
jgi:DNA-binding transcriptional ArsR family regulator